MATETHPESSTLALLRTLVTALEDKKAEQLKVLHVGGVSDITDYLVLATGNSEPHLRALRIEAEKVLDAAKVKIAGMEQGGFNSGWTVVDAYQIMVHFFTAEQREAYSLEKLWKDAAEVDLKTLQPKAEVAAPKRRAEPAKLASKSKSFKSAKPRMAKGARSAEEGAKRVRVKDAPALAPKSGASVPLAAKAVKSAKGAANKAATKKPEPSSKVETEETTSKKAPSAKRSRAKPS